MKLNLNFELETNCIPTVTSKMSELSILLNIHILQLMIEDIFEEHEVEWAEKADTR